MQGKEAREKEVIEVSFTEREINVIIGFIDAQQFDGAKWWVNGIKLDDLKTKLKSYARQKRRTDKKS